MGWSIQWQRHNEFPDLTASFLTEVCHNATTEPPLHLLNGESFKYRSANTESEANLYVRACGFWNRDQDVLLCSTRMQPSL